VRGVTVIDDFAHHPTAIRVTIEGLRQRIGRHGYWPYWNRAPTP
jgi:UDP-N-acetylmuramate: L-alanyl-gamma-D-glutamyl-meso-diaminopimelate ligase